MQDGVHGAGYVNVPAHIMETELKVAVLFEVLNVVPLSGDEVIQAVDGVPQTQEFFTKMAADEARATGDHNPQFPVLLTPSTGCPWLGRPPHPAALGGHPLPQAKGARAGCCELRQAEIKNLRLPSMGDKDISWLDVAMGNALVCAASKPSAI